MTMESRQNVPGTLAAVVATSPATPLDVQADRSKTDVRRFTMLVIPLALLLFTFKV